MDVSIGGAWVSPSGAEVFAGGSWRTLQYGEAYIGGAWRTIANFTPPSPPPPSGGGGGGGGGGSLSLTLSTISISKRARSSTLITNAVTITPSGGLAPYAYAWSIIGYDPGPTYALTAPSFATTSASASIPSSQVTYTATLQCVATDSLGVTATSDVVTATFYQTAGLEPEGSA